MSAAAAPSAQRTPSLAELSAANVAERGPQASPLQALVQDIMLQQQQRSTAQQVRRPAASPALPGCITVAAGAGGDAWGSEVIYMGRLSPDIVDQALHESGGRPPQRLLSCSHTYRAGITKLVL